MEGGVDTRKVSGLLSLKRQVEDSPPPPAYAFPPCAHAPPPSGGQLLKMGEGSAMVAVSEQAGRV